MSTNDPDPKETRVSGQLRSSLGDEAAASAAPPKRPGSNVFNRMPPPRETVPRPAIPPASAPALPTVRRRFRPSGFVFPLVVAAAGIGAGYLLLATTKSLPLALLCGGLGLVGSVFCHILLRDRLEIR